MNALLLLQPRDVAPRGPGRVHYADLGGNTEIVFQQLELDDEARDRHISVIPDTGLAPGMVILAAWRSGSSTRPRTSDPGRRPAARARPPLNYQIVYSLEGVLDYYTTRSWSCATASPCRSMR